MMYDWMFRAETDDTNLPILLDIRRGIEDLGELNGAFRLSDVTDYHPTVVEDEYLHVLGSWRLPERYSPERVVRYVNPNYLHKATYGDVYVECQCGALMGRERDVGGRENEHNHTPDCRASWRQEACQQLREDRRSWLREAAELYLTQSEAGARMGIKRQSAVARVCDRYDIDWQCQRRHGREELVETAEGLHEEYGWNYKTIAEAFGIGYSNLRDQMAKHD